VNLIKTSEIQIERSRPITSGQVTVESPKNDMKSIMTFYNNKEGSATFEHDEH
jgi:hypothetical protein